MHLETKDVELAKKVLDAWQPTGHDRIVLVSEWRKGELWLVLKIEEV